MKSPKSFTLVELIFILVIISSIMAVSLNGLIKYKNTIEYSNSVAQVISDVKLTQQMADASHDICRIEFKAGRNEYRILKNSKVIKQLKTGQKIQFCGKSYFSFVTSGYTEVGGSGTLFLGGSPKVSKIVVSSKGRIRIE